MAAAESEIAAQLIERLLSDPAFRDRFRRDPAQACREAGLESLAEEMQLGGGKAMHTLDVRESRSSLAGVMMAAAMEGMGVYEFSKHVMPHIEDVGGSLGDVLSRVNLPALPGAGSLAGGSAPGTAAPVVPAEEPPADSAGSGGNGAVAPPPAAPREPAGKAAGEAGGKAAGEEAPAPSGDAEPKAAPAGPAEAGDGEAVAPELAGIEDLPDAGATRDEGPAVSELPSGPVKFHAAEGGPDPDAATPAAPEAPAAPAAPAAPEAPAAPAPPPAVEAPAPASGSGPVDAGQFGQQGTGGEPDPQARALLENRNVVLDDVGVADIKAGRIDPRIVAVVTKLSQEHKIVVSCMCSDHSRFTAGGSVSNHAFGRGLDIASIDGEIVSPGSALAREVASELSTLAPAIRPDEIGSPFAISGPGYFTDAAHQNHIHVGFKQEITPEFALPPELAAGTPATPAAPVAPVAPVAAAPAAAAPAAVAPGADRDSGLFAAVMGPGKVAAAGADPNTPAGAGSSDSGLFLQAVAKSQPPAPAAAAGAPVADPAGAPVDLSAVAGEYPGDDAPKAQLAAWMAKQAEQRGLPPQLPVMASLVESGLQNLNFGDADSVGFFQMRLSIWSRDYPGYADDPQKQIDWFLDTAERVKAKRIANGQPIDDPTQYGDWIADIEQPAAQYRGRYQPQLDQANTLLADTPPTTPAARPAPQAVEVAEAPVVRSGPVDAGQFGQQGTGGEPDPQARALLENRNVVLDDVGVADIKAGRIDPRIVAVVTKLSQEHKIVVSCMCSDHSRFTAGGSVSNHAFGRGLDIASIDGEIVSPGSALAREVASELSTLAPAIRPDEIGSPFAISGPGYFTDAAHQNHIHVGFKQEITPEFALPPELAAGTPATPAAPVAPVAPVAAAPAAAAPAAVAPGADRDSGLFAAVMGPGKVAAAGADPNTPAGAGSSDSGLFLQAVAKSQPPAPAAAAGAPVADPAGAPVDLSAVAGEYPGDDAPKAQLAAWMAKQAEQRGLPPQLPVMASLVESGLQNLNFGDADSVGFFQMRLSIWSRDYPGYADDPQKQIDWFLDTAERVKAKRIANGQPIDDPTQYGDWIADIEQPAAQYRGRYQPQLDQANTLLADTPPTTPAATAPASTEEVPADAAPPAMAQGPGPRAVAALKEAQKYTGTPYKWGGSTPETGFDCSGLVQWAYAEAGVKIPRVTDDQIEAANGTTVRRGELLPGDLVFFRDAGGYVHHVGISMGGSKFLHAPHTGDVVKVSSLDEPYYKAQFTGGRRFDEPASGTPAVAPAAATPAAPAIDPAAVAAAQAAAARDAAEARQVDSGLFKAISAQEARKLQAVGAGGGRVAASAAAAGEGAADGPPDSALFLKAVTAEDAARAKAAAPPPAAGTPPAPAADPAAPAAPEVAAATPAPAGPPPDLSGVPADYPGDDAGQAALAKWLAKQAEKAGLPPELPVMAALVESGVKNLNFGDADSVGFFQMRVGIWNRGAYAGYPENPGLQAKWFIDTAVAHKKQQIARGDADFGKDPSKWGEWIADVERPAEQYRGRYQLRLSEARRLLR